MSSSTEAARASRGLLGVSLSREGTASQRRSFRSCESPTQQGKIRYPVVYVRMVWANSFPISHRSHSPWDPMDHVSGD
jgi:hypothetical protein